MNDAYREISEILQKWGVKYAFVVLSNPSNQIIEMGNLNQRAQCLDRIGSVEQPRS